jgi:hypothetical protein
MTRDSDESLRYDELSIDRVMGFYLVGVNVVISLKGDIPIFWPETLLLLLLGIDY